MDELRKKIAEAIGFNTKTWDADFILPNWPYKISDAWRLVDDAERRGLGFRIENLMDADNERQYSATFCDIREYTAIATTAPEAISRAWLAWRARGDV